MVIIEVDPIQQRQQTNLSDTGAYRLDRIIDYFDVTGAKTLGVGLVRDLIAPSIDDWLAWIDPKQYEFNAPCVYERLDSYRTREECDAASTLFQQALLLRHMVIDLYVSAASRKSGYSPEVIDAAITEKATLEGCYGGRGIECSLLEYRYVQAKRKVPSLGLIQGDLNA